MLVALHPGASREDALRTPGIELRLLGVPSDEAARRIALPSGHRGLVPSELRRTGKTLDSAVPEKQPA